ncbi:MAG: family 10 glycosylhydrolase [Cyanobacteria bacterium J06598_1]
MNDIQGHWAQNCIEILAQQGIVAGYPDGTFRPEAPVTRAEFATLITLAFPGVARRPAIGFVDVAADYWAAEKIETVYTTGWLTGYPGNRFRPNLPIPRVQAVIALTAGLGHSPERSVEATLAQVLEDAIAIPTYAKAKMAAAIEQQLVVNYPEVNRFRPNKPATRGEIAALLCQALALQANRASPISYRLIATLPNTEIRGAWLTNIDSEALFSKVGLVTALDRLAEYNFNTVYPTVWNWGYTLYPSAVTTRVFGYKQGLFADTENQGRDDLAESLQESRDMLLELIGLARQRGLSIIPWFEFGLMAPADSPLARLHPDWMTQRQDGTKIDFQNNGKYARVWLNPCHREVQQFLVDLVTELSANYEIDGFQLDDHFGLPIDFGYDATTIALYQSETGNLPPANPKDPIWMRWRADQITQLVGRLHRAVKAYRPKAVFSVSPSPAWFAYDRYLQDWPMWMRSGYVDELLVQVYRRNLESFAYELLRTEMIEARDRTGENRIATGLGVLSGLRQDFMDSALIEAQVKETRQQGYDGVAFFFYESIWQPGHETMARREQMVRSLFPTAKRRPFSD